MKTEVISIHPEFPELDKIEYCARIIRRGGLVIFPTETVYGIAADFNNAKAMARLRKVKQRPQNKPFSIHISQKALLSHYTSLSSPALYKLIDACWPGPLTVIVPTWKEGETIGIRMPQNNIAIQFIEACQCTIAAPSANISGTPPPAACREALKDLDGLVDAAIDGGIARLGQASSVVDFMQPNPTVVREGNISQKEVDGITRKKLVLFVCTGNSCRSVMAEHLLRKMLTGRDDVEVASAGTSVFLHTSASTETVTVLRREGIDVSLHQARALDSILLHKADLIFVMTRTHRQQVIDHVPSVEQRVFLLREFGQQPDGGQMVHDIPDPMGQPPEAYEECLLTIKDALQKVLPLI